MNTEQKKLQTKLGNVWLTVTDANHIYIEFGHHLNVAEEGPGNLRRGPIEIRGVVYGGSIHAYRWADGTFHIGEEGKLPHERYNSLYMSRVHCTTYAQSHPSNAARLTAEKEIMPLVNAWAGENGATFTSAQDARDAEQVKARRERIAELKAEIKTLEAEIRNLEGK